MKRNPFSMFAPGLGALVVTAWAISMWCPAYAQNPVIIEVTTDTGNDTLTPGQPGSIIFSVDANGNSVSALVFPFELLYSGGNFIGPLTDSTNVTPSAEAQARFEFISLVPPYGQGTDPDTMLYGFIDFGGSAWNISGEVFRIDVTPTNLGTVQFDSITLPPNNFLVAQDFTGTPLPLDWRGDGKTIVVSAPPVIIEVTTDTGNDSLTVGQPGSIIFSVDANGNSVSSLIFPFELPFSGANFIGPLTDTTNVTPSAEAQARFEFISLVPLYGQGTSPDTMLYGLIDFGGTAWDISGEVFRIDVTPFTFGTVQFDSITLPPNNFLAAQDGNGVFLPLDWRGDGKPITVTTSPVIIDVVTDTGNDTLTSGQPGSLVFSVDANGNSISTLVFSFEIVFSNGNFLGPLADPGNVFPSTEAQARFEAIIWEPQYGQGTDPDTMLYGLIDFGSSAWDTSGEVFRISTTPNGWGTVQFDSIPLPPANFLAAFDGTGSPLPLDWLGAGKQFVLPCLLVTPGDVNEDAVVTSSDIIQLVNYIFKGGPAPLPCAAAGDATWGVTPCDPTVMTSVVNSADIIYLVNYVFKGGPIPCDVCTIIPSIWSCP